MEVQNRARALDNNMYVIANNLATYYLDQSSDTSIDTFAGGNMIVNYKGEIVGRHDHSGVSAYMAGTIDIEALRDFRAHAQWDNWMKDLMTEQYQLIYERPIYPRNLYLDRAPMKHAEYRKEVIDKQVDLLHERGVWKRPSRG